MARRDRAQASSSRGTRISVTVARGRTEQVRREFAVGEAEGVLTIGSRGDWQIVAPGVVGVHLRLAFDGLRVHAASADGNVLLGSKPIGPEWCALAQGDELRLGFALLRVTEEPAIEPVAAASRRASGNVFGVLLAGASLLGVVAVVGFSLQRQAPGITATSAQPVVASAGRPTTRNAGLDVPPASRQRISECNRLLSALARPGRVEVLDVGSVLLEPDGSISKAMLRD